MIIKSRQRQIEVKGTLRISGTDISEVSTASFVGINIDCNLLWKNHIQIINKSVRKKVGILFRLRHFVPEYILVLLYESFIQPQIIYGIEVWGNTYPSHLNCILLSQKMAMRAITFSAFRTPSKPLFQKLKILDIYKMHNLATNTFVFDLLHGNLPHSPLDYCQIIQHNYTTRGKIDGLLCPPKCKTTHGQFSVSFVGVKLWNCVPKEIREKKTKHTFRMHLTTHSLEL